MEQFVFSCETLKDTQDLAATIGRAVRGGEVLEFISDLGGGKTAFVKGLGVGMGVKDVVQSPTFALSQIHKASRGLELHHFDFYRLTEPGVMSAELAESLYQTNAVTAIEWGEIVHNILPSDRITVNIASSSKGETRKITIFTQEKHVTNALKKYQEEMSKK